MKLSTLICFLFITFSCQVPTQSSTSPNSIIKSVKSGDLETIKRFLAKNEDINAYYNFKASDYTLLCAAVKAGQKEIVGYLVEKKADLNKMSNQKTPLMYAAKYGRLDIAKSLIQKGANKGLISPKGNTALDYAYKYEKSELITFLSN